MMKATDLFSDVPAAPHSSAITLSSHTHSHTHTASPTAEQRGWTFTQLSSLTHHHHDPMSSRCHAQTDRGASHQDSLSLLVVGDLIVNYAVVGGWKCSLTQSVTQF